MSCLLERTLNQRENNSQHNVIRSRLYKQRTPESTACNIHQVQYYHVTQVQRVLSDAG